MREAFFILLIIAVIIALTAYRYRRQISSVYGIWRMLKQARRQQSKNRDSIKGVNEADSGPLVNCTKCGTWVPESRAIKLGARMFYCSAACVERSATAS